MTDKCRFNKTHVFRITHCCMVTGTTGRARHCQDLAGVPKWKLKLLISSFAPFLVKLGSEALTQINEAAPLMHKGQCSPDIHLHGSSPRNAISWMLLHLSIQHGQRLQGWPSIFHTDSCQHATTRGSCCQRGDW